MEMTFDFTHFLQYLCFLLEFAIWSKIYFYLKFVIFFKLIFAFIICIGACVSKFGNKNVFITLRQFWWNFFGVSNFQWEFSIFLKIVSATFLV